MVTQAAKYASYALGPVLVWLGQMWLLYYGVVQAPKWLTFHFPLLPVYAVVAFGLYSVYTVLHGTLSFNDCPEASDQLKREIKLARQDLRKRGMDVED